MHTISLQKCICCFSFIFFFDFYLNNCIHIFIKHKTRYRYIKNHIVHSKHTISGYTDRLFIIKNKEKTANMMWSRHSFVLHFVFLHIVTICDTFWTHDKLRCVGNNLVIFLFMFTFCSKIFTRVCLRTENKVFD